MALILIVDDDKQLREMLRKMLERAGHDVMDAENGKIGEELYCKTPADLVIMDMLMPEKDGVETTNELLLLNPDIKIIALTGGGIQGFDCLREAKSYGAFRTLSKPFSKEDMLNTVNELLSK